MTHASPSTLSGAFLALFSPRPAPLLAVNGNHGYSEDEEGIEDDFPPPPSPGAVEEMNAGLPLAPLHPRYRYALTPVRMADTVV